MPADTKASPWSWKRLKSTLSRSLMERFRTLRFQVLGIVVASVLIPSFFGGWFASTRINDLLREHVYTSIENRTVKLAEQVRHWVTGRTSEVQAFTSSYLLNEEVRGLQEGVSPRNVQTSEDNIQRYLSYLLEDNEIFDGFMILRRDHTVLLEHSMEGVVIKTGDFPEPPGTVPIIREIQGDKEVWLAVIQRMGPGSDATSTLFSAFLKPNALQKAVVNLAPEGTVMYILDQQGVIKMANVGVEPGQVAPEGARKLLADHQERSIYKGLKGGEVIATVVALEELNWAIVLETSRKTALRPLVVFRWQIILMALVLAGLFLIPAIFLARTVVLPLEELSQVSKRIRAGKPGLEVKSRVGGELGEFIETFNSMSLSLQESLEQITANTKELRLMSITDPLTGRYNRRYVEDYLPRELELARRTGQPVTVLMIDLDYFKKYNDTYGHIAGDEALRQLGAILVDNVRKTDVVARFGGEEWLVCLSHTSREGGINIAEKLRSEVDATLFRLKGQETKISISIGVATAPEDGTTYEEILDAADTAMYEAKEAGRNRVHAFTAPGSS